MAVPVVEVELMPQAEGAAEAGEVAVEVGVEVFVEEGGAAVVGVAGEVAGAMATVWGGGPGGMPATTIIIPMMTPTSMVTLHLTLTVMLLQRRRPRLPSKDLLPIIPGIIYWQSAIIIPS